MQCSSIAIENFNDQDTCVDRALHTTARRKDVCHNVLGYWIMFFFLSSIAHMVASSKPMIDKLYKAATGHINNPNLTVAFSLIVAAAKL